MPLPQYILRDVGGRLGIYLPQRPSPASATISVRNESAGVLGTVDAVAMAFAGPGGASTTTTAAVARGATTVALTAVTGVIAGFDYELGPANPTTGLEPRETVRVRSVSALVATLARPTVYAHATGATLASTLATYDVTAAQATAMFLHGHGEVIWTDLDGLTQRTYFRVSSTLKAPEAYMGRRFPHADCCEQDLFDRDPYWDQEATQDLRGFLAFCRDEVLATLGARFHARTLIGADLLVDATAYLALAKQRERLAQQRSEKTRNPFREEYARAIEEIRSIGAADENQDGRIQPWEGPRRAIRISRSS